MTMSEKARYIRFKLGSEVSYGRLEGEVVKVLEGDLFASARETGQSVAYDAVTLLPPSEPSKVIAVGLNYRSHLRDRPEPEYPGLFAKFPSSLIGHGQPIVIPADAKEVHYEGELVVVIGKETRNVSIGQAHEHVFGVTAGNDVSERNWQRNDLQWVRAKGSDTFGPVGPAIVTGVDYSNLALETRLNGEVRQSTRTQDLIFGVDTLVSFISRYLTLKPGDLIFTGTPGSTQAMRPGDEVEVELEKVGILRNSIVATER
jgi:2-keto-4-pentenoate hydratase/2-oxohepta-3-ene-1,7-dioic acid hydratase in catechol pathway